MRLSVAMATWNGERFLAEQLDSIAKQSRLPDELVISDDCSSDRTPEIAQRFAARAPFEVRLLENDRRLDWMDNFFRAMSACTGDLIALCDQDDVWHADKLARCEQELRADPQVSVVNHSARVVDEYLQPIWSDPRNHIRRRRRLSAGCVQPFHFPRCGFAMTFRADFFRAVGIDNRPDQSPGVDGRMFHDTWIQFVGGAVGATVLLPDELVLYRRHAESATPAWSDHLTGSVARTRWERITARTRNVRGRLEKSLAHGSEEQVYRTRSRDARERQTYLESLRPAIKTLGQPACLGLERSIRSHRRYAEVLERRANAYVDHRAYARVASVARGAFGGDYGPRSRGGIGLQSLARDALVAGLPRAKQDGATDKGGSAAEEEIGDATEWTPT